MLTKRILALRPRDPQEGGAAVEFAALSLVMVPLWLFTMFSSDTMFHMLDVQEAVIATTWDMSQVQFGNQAHQVDIDSTGSSTSVAKMNRLQFADHDSSFINEGAISGGKFSGDNHHTNAFSHTCWCNGGTGDACDDGFTEFTDMSSSHQVHCKQIKDKDSYILPPAESFRGFEAGEPGGTGGNGATIECGAKGWLYNYIIPEHLIQGIPANEKIPLFNKKRHFNPGMPTSPHGISGDSTADILLRDHAGILVDPWAVTDKGSVTSTVPEMHRNVDSTTDQMFYKRTKHMFNYVVWYALPSADAFSFLQEGRDKELLGSLTFLGVIPTGPPSTALDNIVGLWMNALYPMPPPNDCPDQRGGYKDGDDFFTTPLRDESDARTSYDARGCHYLGKTN
jgi:hypothetical protein